MSKFITLQDLHNKTECPINISIFQEAGLDKVDFDKIKNFKVPYGYFNDLLWLINNFNLTFSVRYNEQEIYYYKNGNRVRIEKVYGFWENYKFDKMGNKIESIDAKGYQKKWEYDKFGNRITHKDSNGLLEKWKYDKSGNQIRYELFNKINYWREMEYDQSRNRIYQIDSTGFWEKWQYNENEILIRYEKSSGLLEKWKMNQDGLLIKVRVHEDKSYEDAIINDLKVSLALSTI